MIATLFVVVVVDNKTKERIDFIKTILSEKNTFSEKVWDIEVIPYLNGYRTKRRF